MERIFSIAVLSAVLYGCAAEGTDTGGLRFEGAFAEDNTRVEISADEASGASRLLWQENDRIGIFSDAGHVNVPYRCTEASAIAEFRPENELIRDGEKFRAYYPYTSDGDGYGADSFVCGVPRQQSFADADNADKLFMRAAAVKSQEGVVSFEFESVFSVLELGLKGDAVLSSLTVEADVPLAGDAVLDSGGGIVGFSEESNSVRVDFGPEGLALGDKAVGVPVGILPFASSGPVTITFEDMAAGRFVKSIWPQGMAIAANTHAVQPLAFVRSADFAPAAVWNDDFSDVSLPDSDLFGQLVSGGYVYQTEGLFSLISGQLRVGARNKYAYIALPQLLGQGIGADLDVEISARALTSSGSTVEIYVSGSGTLSESAVTVADAQQYSSFGVSVNGADASTRLRLGGAGFYLGGLKIVCRNR